MFLWMCKKGTLHQMKMSNYAGDILQTFNSPHDYQSNQIIIDFGFNIQRIGFSNTFLDITSLDFYKVVLLEKQNGGSVII